ncbi:MAG TPA: hypothetical protein VGK20_11815 [Candidatus Binatia bacterium]|jgi:hypothetical protein
MPASLAQRTVFDDSHAAGLRLPLDDALAALHPGASFPLIEDPRRLSRALVFGMMVLRPASRAWNPDARGPMVDALPLVGDWCYDVAGIGGSWPVSAGNAVDAFRLALQYGTVDAVIAGATTVCREGVGSDVAPGHIWQAWHAFSWPVLRPWRDSLEPAVARTRRRWQELGVISERPHPAQIVVTRSGLSPLPGRELLDARIFRERHPDGSAIEARIVTSEAGAEAVRRQAGARGRRIDAMLLVASPPDDPCAIDVARVPALLRERLDVRVAEHDGGAISLAAFVDAGAVSQLNLTLMRRRSVRDVVARSTRIGAALRDEVLESWERRPRYFPPAGGALPSSWRPFFAVAEEGDDGEAVAVSFEVRTRS